MTVMTCSAIILDGQDGEKDAELRAEAAGVAQALLVVWLQRFRLGCGALTTMAATVYVDRAFFQALCAPAPPVRRPQPPLDLSKMGAKMLDTFVHHDLAAFAGHSEGQQAILRKLWSLPQEEQVPEILVDPSGELELKGVSMDTASHDVTGGLKAKLESAAAVLSGAPSVQAVYIVKAGSNAAAQDYPHNSFRDCDAVFCHPRTGAVLFVGSHVAAKDAAFLEEYHIRHIVNCQEPSSPNYFEGDPGFEYFRFDVANWKREVRVETAQDAQHYVSSVLEFLDAALDSGSNVLVHCHAGAHRAGTTAVAYLMHAHGISPSAAAVVRV
ncbi:Mkp3 [Symbiodinium natans]|uniref:protein-tyrosine-phosphatase n=1 Tax=Symbiodinium natans TaxID=878477 RepID=A0A812QL86_9DINO|nr:Mkp3 [Symbiodinium natans]